jgi:S-adenosylmethionine/arginine decarboxylase-like enzyme
VPTFTPVDHDPFIDEGTSVLDDTTENIPSKRKSWGVHLLVDADGCNKEIDSEKDIKEFFHNMIINKLKMKELSDVLFEKVDDPEDGRGISAIQMLTTSHISLHGDDKGNKIFLDIFSCKFFEKEPVLKYIHEFFRPKRMVYREIFRDAGPGKQ